MSNIDHESVCGHFKATYSGILPNDKIQEIVGRWNNLPPPLFEAKAKQIALIFSRAMQGRYDVSPSEVPNLSTNGLKVYQTSYGDVIGTRFNDQEIDSLLSLPASGQKYKLMAGMTNLKSALVITGLTREQKVEQREAIRHTVTIDTNLLREWNDFVEEYTPRLLRHMPFAPREYDPIWMVPLGNKGSATLTKDGQIARCTRGDEQSLDMYNQLRHPELNRLVREYPTDAAAALLYGWDPRSVTIGPRFPEPLHGNIPIGVISIAPKLAQKARVVYIGLTATDVMQRPAFHAMMHICKHWNMQGVASHDIARDYVRMRVTQNMRSRHPSDIHSYDQSSFTDNFSYDWIQRPVAAALVKHGILRPFDLALMDTVNHGSWEASKLGFKYELLNFGTGTGMGTPDSFVLASITNGYMVAFSRYKAVGRYAENIGEPPGKVTGDDCVIFHPETAQWYEWFCDQIGLKLNHSKTIVAPDVAEFCGKFIRSEGIYDKRKLMPVTSQESLVETLRYYQDREEEFLSAFQEGLQIDPPTVVERLKAIPEPIGLGRPVENIPVDELTPVEAVVKTTAQIGQLEQTLPKLEVTAKEGWVVHDRKKSVKLLFEEKDMTPVEETVHQIPWSPNGYQEALIRNALMQRDIMLRSAESETIYDSARFIEQVYYTLLADDPKLLDHVQAPGPDLAPDRERLEKRRQHNRPEVERLTRFLGLPSLGKEVDICESTDPGLSRD